MTQQLLALNPKIFAWY